MYKIPLRQTIISIRTVHITIVIIPFSLKSRNDTYNDLPTLSPTAQFALFRATFCDLVHVLSYVILCFVVSRYF